MKTSLPLALASALLAPGLVAVGSSAPAAAAPAPVELSARSGLSAPSAVQVGTSFTIKGKVKVRSKARRHKRVVKRVVKARLGQDVVDKVKANRRGKFTLRITAGTTPGTATYVVSTRKADGLKAYKRSVSVTVAPAPSSAVTSTWPAAVVSVPLGQAIAVSGAVTGTQPGGRTVVIQQYLGNAWLDRISTTSAADGTYAASLPAAWIFSAPARVVVKALGGVPEAAAPEITASVTPTWTPGGSATSWVPVYPESPLRLNPCETVEYSANLAQAPALAREALDDALTSVSQATGITFVNVGDSTGVGRPEPGFTGIPTNADLLIAWVTDNQTTVSQPPTNGGATLHDKETYGSDAFGPIQVAKKTAINMNVAYRGGWTRTLMTHVYRHELGHVIGLGHPTAQDQVMGAGEAASTNFPWGAGDLAGFARLGLQSGCVIG